MPRWTPRGSSMARARHSQRSSCARCTGVMGAVSPSRRASAEPQKPSPAGIVEIPEFMRLRLAGYTCVEYETGERELYNVSEDPEELRNLAGSAPPAFIAELHQRLADLSECAADSCRDDELKAVTLMP